MNKKDNLKYFDDRWFEIFNYLYRNHHISAPSNHKKFDNFMTKLSKTKVEVYHSLMNHLDETNPETLIRLLK